MNRARSRRRRGVAQLLVLTGVVAALAPGAAVAAPADPDPRGVQSSSPPALWPSPTGPSATPTGRTAAGVPSRFVALAPARILDTRTGLGGSPRLGAGQTMTLQVTGLGGVPAGATAVALNLTADKTGGAGFVSAWPAGLAQPTVSNVNVTGAGQSVANLAVVALPANGQVSLFSSDATDLIADVAGYFVASPSATDGRFVGQVPQRVLDTRSGARVPADGTVDVPIAGHAGVPATGVSAVVLTVTGTEAGGAGFVTTWPTGADRPTASVLNLPGPGATVANLVVVPLGTGGSVSLYSYSGGHLVADVAGYVTDGSAPSSTAGLFVPLTPERVLDSRIGLGFACRVGAGQTFDLKLANTAGIPASGVGAVLTNLTVAEPGGAGFVTGWPALTARPTASNVNVSGAGHTVAAAAVTAVGQGASVSLYSYSSAHVLADVAGYFLGSPVASDGTAAPAAECAVSPSAGWIETFNVYRSMAGLPPVVENPAWQSGLDLHSQWMVTNETIGHSEIPGSPIYTPEGDEAGKNSNVSAGSGSFPPPEQIIEGWMTAPFHAAAMLDPALTATGFSLKGDIDFWAASLDVRRGADVEYDTIITAPVLWPGPGSTVPVNAFAGNESPDPGLACPGFDGLPVVVMLPGHRFEIPEPTNGFTAQMSGPGGALEVCTIASSTRPEYAGLSYTNGAIVMPRDPLADGTYTVTIASSTQAPITWSFSVDT